MRTRVLADFVLLLFTTALVRGAVLPLDNILLLEDTRSKCTDGVHIIVARETGAPPGEGKMKSVSNAIKEEIDESDSVSVDYPASILPSYGDSVIKGVKAMKKMVVDYVTACPDAEIVLLGYSQGAHVLGSVLCGETAEGFEPLPPIDDKYGKNVIAAISMGDPTHVPGMPYNRGTSTRRGWFPRRYNEACKRHDSIRRSYCDTGDVFCDLGANTTVHGLYVEKYGENAVDFVECKEDD